MKEAASTGDRQRTSQPERREPEVRGVALAPPAGLAFLERVKDGKVQFERRELAGRQPARGAGIPGIAARGVDGPGGPLPHLDAIRRAFGRHDVGGVVAHTGPEASRAAHEIGAAAYATGNHVAFAGPPSLHTAAHEAAHVVQQRAGVHLAGGVGEAGDEYERHADGVADRVVRGESAEALLDRFAGSADPPAGPAVVQRRDMRAVMIDQRAREKKIDERVKSKSKDPGLYTTVGFEWDIAVTGARSNDHANVLEGLTHVELAESTLKWNGLPYLLETDAGNVLEFVTPPFYVRTAAPGTSLPDLADLNDIVDSTRESLAGLAASGDTLAQVMAKPNWARFALGAWTANELEVDWHNWSPRAQDGDTTEAGLDAWQAIRIAQATLEKQPQINIAATGHDYAQAQDSGDSRLGDKDPYVKATSDLEKKLNDYVANGARKLLPDDEQGARIKLVIDQTIRVMAQQRIVALITELAGLQQQGWDGADVGNAFRKVSGAPSYIKDSGTVWLKTDLFTFAAGVLRPLDWAVLAGERGLLQGMRKALGKAKLGKDIEVEPLDAVLAALQVHANALANVDGSDGPSRQKNREKYILEQFKRISGGLPGFNEHNPAILGVRQDTFIKPDVMLKLSNRLGLGGMLSVMEVRNTPDFLKWLASGEKKKSKSSGSSVVEVDPVPILGDTLFPNETAGDGNCFFHALYESENGARSSVVLQGAIRQSVVDALGQRNDICMSHFGPQGNASPEYNHYAAEILADTNWVSDQTPAIVSDALNKRIIIHNPDGTVYYDAQPNPTFVYPHPMTTVHVMYTGNHYNSYTNPPLPPDVD